MSGSAQQQTAAALDVGSNTVRLLIASVDPSGRLDPVLDRSSFARLGMGVESSGQLREDRMRIALDAIGEFQRLCAALGIEELPAVATSAVRDARNGAEFVERVREETGVDVAIVSGEREAELTFMGATAGTDPEVDVVVMDLGGGSAELVAGRAGKPQRAFSLPLGAGRITERFVSHDPPQPGELDAVAEHVRAALPEDAALRGRVLLFTGGTASHVASLQEIRESPARIDAARLDQTLRLLVSAPSAEIAQRHSIDPGRAKVLPAGVGALRAALDVLQPSEALITHGGLREGIILDSLRRTAS
jgi:exopolyphosphatase/guanosine-5'-triphosphate,3'-diphosphate pyrophosphatase